MNEGRNKGMRDQNGTPTAKVPTETPAGLLQLLHIVLQEKTLCGLKIGIFTQDSQFHWTLDGATVTSCHCVYSCKTLPPPG